MIKAVQPVENDIIDGTHEHIIHDVNHMTEVIEIDIVNDLVVLSVWILDMNQLWTHRVMRNPTLGFGTRDVAVWLVI
jgi:hypothetical protein